MQLAFGLAALPHNLEIAKLAQSRSGFDISIRFPSNPSKQELPRQRSSIFVDLVEQCSQPDDGFYAPAKNDRPLRAQRLLLWILCVEFLAGPIGMNLPKLSIG